MTSRTVLIERAARAISPYGWDDAYWASETRRDRYDRNQRHVQQHALRQAEAALDALVPPGEAWIAPWTLPDSATELGGVGIKSWWEELRTDSLTQPDTGE